MLQQQDPNQLAHQPTTSKAITKYHQTSKANKVEAAPIEMKVIKSTEADSLGKTQLALNIAKPISWIHAVLKRKVKGVLLIQILVLSKAKFHNSKWIQVYIVVKNNKSNISNRSNGLQVQIKAQAELTILGHQIVDSADDNNNNNNHQIKITELGRCPKGNKTKWLFQATMKFKKMGMINE